jgi:arginine/lysine/ornithine decarboxylase
MATAGEKLWAQVLEVADRCRYALEQTQIPCLNPNQIALPLHHWDRSRLTIATDQWGLTGFEVDEHLDQTQGVLAELVQPSRLTFLFGLGHTPADSDRLIAALANVSIRLETPRPTLEPALNLSDLPEIVTPPYSPREAQFAAQEWVPLEEAIGRISAALVCAYPPGIPLLLPGEWISATAVANLKTLCRNKATLTGLLSREGSRLAVLKL